MPAGKFPAAEITAQATRAYAAVARQEQERELTRDALTAYAATCYANASGSSDVLYWIRRAHAAEELAKGYR